MNAEPRSNPVRCELVVETRVLRWTVPGYEDSFTQYQVWDDGTLWITQVALRNNMARAMQGPPTCWRHLTVEDAKATADQLLMSRLDAAEEVVPAFIEAGEQP